MRLPVNKPYVITTTFGEPDSNALFGRHSGIDYAVPLNRPVYAPASGQLENVVSKTGGNMVRIFDGNKYHRLLHNNSFSRGNGWVDEGQEVAKAGTTGLSTGVHSHWDVTSKAVPTSFSDFVDPMEYIKQGGDMPSKVDIDRVNELFVAFWTRPQIEAEAQKAGKTVDQWLQGWVGTESNSLVRDLAASSQYRNKRLDAENELAVLKKQVADCQSGGTVLAPGTYKVKE